LNYRQPSTSSGQEKKLPIFVEARTIIMALQYLFDENKTPSDTKMKIKMIFEVMDTRDQAYRFSRDCHCKSCEPRAKPN